MLSGNKLTFLNSETNTAVEKEETCRALTPLFGNGAGAFRIGKNSVVLTKIRKIYKVLCIKEFIVRLI